MSEEKYVTEIGRAAEAKRILESPLIKEAFEGLRKNYTTTWENSPARDTEGREAVWLALKVLKGVETQLNTIIKTGELASISLEKLRE